MNDISIELNRPTTLSTFKAYLEHKNISFHLFITKLRTNLHKIIESNKKDLTQYCIRDQKHFQIYALDMEMDTDLNPVLYPRSKTFSNIRIRYGNGY
jgi:hypothetical protein